MCSKETITVIIIAKKIKIILKTNEGEEHFLHTTSSIFFC